MATTLGSFVKDNISGFSGIATGRVRHLHGCVHIIVTPTDLKDGQLKREELFDEQRVETTDGDHPAYVNHVESVLPFSLGSKVEDRVSGLVGLAHCYESSLFHKGKVAIIPEGLDKDGNIHKVAWVDISAVDLIEERTPEVSEESINPTQTGSCYGLSHSSAKD